MHLTRLQIRTFLIPVLGIVLSGSANSKASSLALNSKEYPLQVEDEKSNQCNCECHAFPRPTDCEEIRQNGQNVSGVYTIYPKSRTMGCETMKVYCDMHTNGGGWTVLQRRGDYGSVFDYFDKTWEYYKSGFGVLEKDFWIGNDNLCALTNQDSYSVRFDLRHMNGTSVHALYEKFWIDDESQQYKLHISGYSGTAGDSMSHHNAMKFHTRDKDTSNTCAKDRTGGWWFNPSSCTRSNLNGQHIRGIYTTTKKGIEWFSFGSESNAIVFSEIKIRPQNFK